VLLGLALTAATTHWRLYLPFEWGGPGPYFLYTISNLSRDLLLAAIGAIWLMLVETRDWRWVAGLRYALAAYAFLTVLKMLADIYCLPSATTLDALSLAFPCVWFVYFGVSRRVRRVFFDKSW
jgi:hypothetical protein